MGLVSQLRERYSNLDSFLRKPSIYWSIRIIFRLYVLVVFGYCLLPFILLTLPKWTRALAQLHYFGHAIYLPWILIGPFLIPILRPRKKVKEEGDSNKTQWWKTLLSTLCSSMEMELLIVVINWLAGDLKKWFSNEKRDSRNLKICTLFLYQYLNNFPFPPFKTQSHQQIQSSSNQWSVCLSPDAFLKNH